MENLNSLISLSGKLLLNVKLNVTTSTEEQKLRSLSIKELQQQLNTEEDKKTFWINIYNAYFQILSNREKLHRKTIFTKKTILIAQTRFSLDDIEHGILRKYRWKFSFGYITNPLVPSLIKNLSVQKIDYRIHFALNCGAKSCPPIAFYTADNLDKQLDDAMDSFILSETVIDMNNKTITTSKLLHWYRGDFGGTPGIKKVLQQVLGIQFNNYKLSFNEYSWELNLENYIN
jgi:hypothetical protein